MRNGIPVECITKIQDQSALQNAANFLLCMQSKIHPGLEERVKFQNFLLASWATIQPDAIRLLQKINELKRDLSNQQMIDLVISINKLIPNEQGKSRIDNVHSTLSGYYDTIDNYVNDNAIKPIDNNTGFSK